jgi:AcrR family transcriptional regulator
LRARHTTSSETPKRRQSRSERTRQKIKEAVIALLNEQNYFDLTITEICQTAGIATGGFYFHYEKKADLIDEMLREHNANFWSVLMAALDYRDPFSAIHHASTALVRAFHDSPGLVRCFNQLAMIDRSYVRLWETAATNWAAQLATMLGSSGEVRRGAVHKSNVYGLLSFADLLLFGLYIERDPALVAAAGPADEVIENLAVLWFRALTGHSPPAARLAYANRGQGV